MTDAEILDLHRRLVATPSPSHEEGPICDLLQDWFAERGVEVERIGDNLVALCGDGPLLCFNSHLDTVPPSPAWTRPPWQVEVEEGRVYGLGSNDAKASVAAMIGAFLRLRARGPEAKVRLLLTLVCEEETGGKGTEMLLPELARRGLRPQAAVVGEPTGLDLAVAQKGMLVLQLQAEGRACHAAHGRALGAPNALRILARDLVAVDSVELGPEHSRLGPVTLEPTVASGGSARNMVPAQASCVLDVRTNPQPEPRAIVARLRAAVQGRIEILSERLRPCEVPVEHPVVQAARRARPQAELIGSRTVSDWVFFEGIPALKAGPGRTERSHGPDEFVLESEILEGARFYEDLAVAWAELAAEGRC